MSQCEFHHLGTLGYAESLAQQEDLAAQRKRGEAPDTLLLLEHEHVITLGRSAKRSNVIADDDERDEWGCQLFETGRGGDVTYHGPGQLVGYPIINLAPDRCDVRRYLRDLEEVIIRTAADFSITGERIPGRTGVWVSDEKVAAIGVRISRWVTMHGFALNVTTNLDYFSLIVPCGISDCRVTSLEKLTGRRLTLREVADRVVHHFGRVFNREMVAREPISLSTVR